MLVAMIVPFPLKWIPSEVAGTIEYDVIACEGRVAVQAEFLVVKEETDKIGCDVASTE